MRHHRDGSIERCLCSRDLQSFPYFGENCCTLSFALPQEGAGSKGSRLRPYWRGVWPWGFGCTQFGAI